ncbi:MAG: glutaminyl-peptide cyclotransferase [Gammaproteobacteria bacterium]|nr:glutaminyl-peptide cyclotransferase [Gammaproteobacteria bacterium]
MNSEAAGGGSSGAGPVPVYGYRIVRVYPHDRNAFTQGLVYLNGELYESTGLNGASSVRRVDLRSGRVSQQMPLDGKYFGEGLAAWGPNLILLTLRSNIGFVYDRASLRLRQTFTYAGEGWGLTQDGTRLIMSDGTSVLRFLNPWTMQGQGVLPVRDGGREVAGLNELEFVNGEIFANIWPTDRVARIAPGTGAVTGWIDLSGLLAPADKVAPGSVLNGIAYDAANDRLFVTGKRWPRLFEIKLVPRGSNQP